MSDRAAFIVVTHLMGVGHYVRAVAVGRALAQAGWRVVIASGGAPVANIDAAGCEIVHLPPLHCVDADFRRLLRADGTLADADYLARRSRLLLETFDRVAPDVVVTELFPFGRRRLAAEFEALLAHARRAGKRPAILCSIRDVLHPPSDAGKVADAAARLARFYDAALFHGDERIVPLTASWPADAALLRRLRPTGYVRDQARSDAPAVAGADGEGEIVVSGGGSAAGSHLGRIAVEVARLTQNRRWRILVGRGVSEDDFGAMRAAAPANAVVEWARVDFPALLARAALSVSQAGYNTVLDLAAARARAILVPFAGGGESEQEMRADHLARRGFARVIDEKRLTPEELAAAVEAAIAAPRPDWSPVRLDGAERTALLVEEERARAAARDAAWRRLNATLDDLRRAGKVAPVWLRDDDTVEMTGALRRWLETLAAHGVPATLAVIPARASDALARDLAAFPDIRVIVHGWAHENHARPEAKKCEFPETRLHADMMADARRGLERLAPLAMPVFTPPWNRAAAAFLSGLHAAGYRGVSLFSATRRCVGDDAMRRVDTHWDPIAWRAGGGLADEAALLDRLSDLLAQELDEGVREPLGLLTHHLVHDGWIARFLDECLGTLARSGAVRFLRGEEVFRLTRDSQNGRWYR